MSFGFINVDKPSGLTSHDVVSIMRKICSEKQVGHAGTLDPMATGVLPIAIGKACRLIRFLSGSKIYTAEILLGKKTDTDDIEGSVLEEKILPKDLSDTLIKEKLNAFIGSIEQIPPLYSAIHHEGKRLYDLARENKAPENIKARQVKVESIEIISIALPVVKVKIECSEGTYIRSIARDLGDKLDSGACLCSLRREKSGPFQLNQAVPLKQLQETPELFQTKIVNPTSVLAMPSVDIDEQETLYIQQGKALTITSTRINTKESNNSDRLLAVKEGKLVAVCQYTFDSANTSSRVRPEVVISNGK